MELVVRILRGERPFESLQRGSETCYILTEANLLELVGLSRKVASLSPRQAQILRLVSGGKSNKAIASELGISIRTVETHRLLARRRVIDVRIDQKTI